MAVKIKAGDDVKRGDLFHVDPFQVEVKEDLRGRCQPPSHDYIAALAVSLLEHGQLQPVVARRNSDQRLVLTAGFTRCAAVRMIRKGFTYAPEGQEPQEYKDENFKLQVKVSDCNDEQAFIRNVVENAQRKATSPMDDAINQERMRENYGMNDSEIARTYGYSSSVKVGRLKKLLLLEKPEQQLVHDGKLSVQGGIDLLDVPPEKRAQVVADATNEKGKVSGSKIVDAIRDDQLAGQGDDDPFNGILNDDDNPLPENDGTEPDSDEEPKARPRTRSKIVKFFALDDDIEHDPAVERFAKDFLKYAEGKATDKQMVNALYRLLDAKRAA